MYYISYIEEYPIYEPAEGGYYYAGRSVIDVRPCKTWRKARKVFNEWRRWFEKEFGRAGENGVSAYMPGGCDKYGDGQIIRQNSKYVGDGKYVMLTRYEPHDKGYEPYC